MLCPATGRNNFYGQEEKKMEFSGGDICGRCGKEQVAGRLFSRGDNLVRRKGFEGEVSKDRRRVPCMSGSAQIYVLTTHLERQ